MLACRHHALRNGSGQSSNRPFIPPEVWGIVIHHACLSDHDPLDTLQQLSFLESASTQLATYRAAMHIKLVLCLVSRQWSMLSRPYLYEFVWIRRASQAKLLVRTLTQEGVRNCESSGKYIRRLHIETPTLERCCPADLRAILDHASQLSVFSDHHSVQHNQTDITYSHRCSPEEILKLVAHPKIRRLHWTSYDDVPFQLRMHPFTHNLATRLEYLELSSYSSNSVSIGAEFIAHSAANRIDMNVHLPSLRALKVSLDNNMFSALASWNMPLLTHLSVLSSDFSYTGAGFSLFFQEHGIKLRQLELGHSSSSIEEYYLTTPRHVLRMQQNQQIPRPVPLADWCPNLREFICSADAEWHWQSPDWIAPHILLPAHPRVELIGIRDIDKRLREDAPFTGADFDTPYFSLFEQMSSLLRTDAFPNLRFVRDLSVESHRMRTARPAVRVVQFWTNVVARCRERAIWLEDCFGVNITLRNLRQAALL